MARFTTKRDTTLPVIAIDLGYSANNRSCGFAHSGTNVTCALKFGECIEAVEKLIREKGPHTLIIEAVLSTYHRHDGNPDIRGEFERGRGWYYGPGVSTYAGAMRFLSELDRKLPKLKQALPLIEGLLSFKKARTEHTEDARRILKEIQIAERHIPTLGSEPILPIIDAAPRIYKYLS